MKKREYYFHLEIIVHFWNFTFPQIIILLGNLDNINYFFPVIPILNGGERANGKK